MRHLVLRGRYKLIRTTFRPVVYRLCSSNTSSSTESVKTTKEAAEVEESVHLTIKHLNDHVAVAMLSTPSERARKLAVRRLRILQDAVFNPTKIIGLITKIPGLLWRVTKTTGSYLFKAVKEPGKTRKKLWNTIKHEVKHYKKGFKLAAMEVHTASQIVHQRAKGKRLSRREHKQISRTVNDLAKIPIMLLFIITPFLEFALPVALKLFPSMLPSTFEDSKKEEEKLKKQLRVRLEIGEYFKESVLDIDRTDTNRKELISFFKLLRKGQNIPQETVYKMSKFFSDQWGLDNMTKEKLILLCRYMGIGTYYPNEAFLRSLIRRKLEGLRRDDETIKAEGVESLNLRELQNACAEWGMRALGLSKPALELQLKQWIEFSVNKEIPVTLLILSRAFIISDFGKRDSFARAIKETISSLGIEKVQLSSVEEVPIDASKLTEDTLEAIRTNTLLENMKRRKISAVKTEEEDEKLSLVDEVLETQTDRVNEGVLARGRIREIEQEEEEYIPSSEIREIIEKVVDEKISKEDQDKIIEVLDPDNDGLVNVDDVEKYIMENRRVNE